MRSIISILSLLAFALASAGTICAEELWVKVGAEGERLFCDSTLPGEYGAFGSLGAELRGLFGCGLSAGLRLSYGAFLPSDEWVKDFSMGIALVSVGYRLPLRGAFSLSPYAGAGVSLVTLTAAESLADYEAGSSSANIGTQLVAEAGIEGEFALNKRISLELRPAYRLLAESGGLYHLASVSLGVSFKALELDLFGRRARSEAKLASAILPALQEAPGAEPMPDAETALSRLGKEPNIRVERSEGEIKVIVEGCFNKNDAKLEDRTKAQLDLVGAVIRDLKPVAMRVDGYVAKDQLIGTDWIVSVSRAEAVRDWLLLSPYLAGLSLKIEARGLGRTNPVADDGTEAGRSRNRRVEIVLTVAEGTAQ